MWNEKTISLNPFKRCECGKIHVTTLVWGNTKCDCGRPLHNLAWEIKENK